MKLAELLQHRSDCSKKINSLITMMTNNAVYQEGSEPDIDINTLNEYLVLMDKVEELVYTINTINNNTIVDGKNLTYWIVKKESLRKKIRFLNGLISASTPTIRYRNTEIKQLSALNLNDLRTKIDELSKELRVIDNLIQSTNWSTEVNCNIDLTK